MARGPWIIKVRPVSSGESLKEEKLFWLWSEKDVRCEDNSGVKDTEGGRRGHEPRNVVSSRSWKRPGSRLSSGGPADTLT